MANLLDDDLKQRARRIEETLADTTLGRETLGGKGEPGGAPTTPLGNGNRPSNDPLYSRAIQIVQDIAEGKRNSASETELIMTPRRLSEEFARDGQFGGHNQKVSVRRAQSFLDAMAQNGLIYDPAPHSVSNKHYMAMFGNSSASQNEESVFIRGDGGEGRMAESSPPPLVKGPVIPETETTRPGAGIPGNPEKEPETPESKTKAKLPEKKLESPENGPPTTPSNDPETKTDLANKNERLAWLLSLYKIPYNKTTHAQYVHKHSDSHVHMSTFGGKEVHHYDDKIIVKGKHGHHDYVGHTLRIMHEWGGKAKVSGSKHHQLMSVMHGAAAGISVKATGLSKREVEAAQKYGIENLRTFYENAHRHTPPWTIREMEQEEAAKATTPNPPKAKGAAAGASPS